jgi:hypothetical protein
MNLTKFFQAGCAALVLVGSVVPQSLAQSDVPRTASGKPDLNGFWEFPYVPNMSAGGNGRTMTGPGELPLLRPVN